jgi:protoheme ferro-lyase
MEKMTSNIIIARHKENNNIYKHIEGSIFQNVINEKQKELSSDELKDFVINGRLTTMANENPLLLVLIKNLKLQYES